MRSVSDGYKLAITQPREITAEIRYNDLILDEDTINSINYNVNCDYFKTVMQQVDLDIDNQIAIDTDINVKFGVRVNDVYEFVDYGKYKIYGLESNKDTKSYKAVCYDKMLDSMVDYDIKIPDNTSIRDVWILIFNELGWDTSVIPEMFINSSKVLPFDCWTGLKMSYRDVLDELCTISCVWLADFNGIVKMVQINNTNEVIDEEYLSDTNVTIGDKIFFNSVVFSRSAESDNIYRRDETSISENGLHEFKIKDYQILNGNNRDDFIDEMFEYLKTLEFYSFDAQTKGITFLEKIDGFNFQIEDKIYPVIMLNNETNITSGLLEYVYADKPKESQTEYKYASSSDKLQQNANLIVDKQLAKILAKVTQKVDNEEIIASLNLAIENGQGVVRFISNQFLVEADNLKIDQYGSVQMSNAEIVGGNIELFDDGTRDGSSIKIHTKIDYGTPITLGTDLSNKKLLFNFDKNTVLPIDIESGKFYTLLKTDNFQIQLYMTEQTTPIKMKSYFVYYNYLDSTSRNRIAIIRHLIDGVPNSVTKIINDLQLNETAGVVTYIADYSLNSEIVITDQIDKVTNISGYGIDTIIAPRFNYDWDDMAYIMEKLENNGTFTENDIFKYDLNLDGTIDIDDYYNVQWFVLNDITIENPARLKINTQNAKDNFVLTDGYGTDRVAIDFSGIRFKSNTHLSIENDFGEEVINLGADGINIDKGIMSDLFQNNILWQANNSVGGYYMTADHTVTLSEKISDQSHGIILVWWAFNPSTQSLVGGPVVQQVIPKYLISDNAMTFHQDMHYANFTYSGTKVVYITDSSISGNDGNTAVGTGGSGIKYNNNRFVLSYVIGF